MTDTTRDTPQAGAAKKQTEQNEAAKKTLAEQNEARQKSQDERNKMAAGVKPTPTQEENDLAAVGVHLDEHEPDGSPPENEPTTKAMQGGRGAPYQTRTTEPAHKK